MLVFRPIISIIIILLEPFMWLLERVCSLNGINGEYLTLRFRGILYSAYWKSKSLKIGNNIKLVNPQNFKIGFNVTLHSGGSYITSRTEKLIIGDNTHISRYSVLAGGGGISIGKNCAISSHVVIYSVSTTFDDINIPITEQPAKKAKVVIGDNVLIGAGAVILPGVQIGDNSVIGAGSLVSKHVANNAIVAGVPAQLIRMKDNPLI